MCNPHQVTKDFESALCAYTGAPYAVAVNSCTMALLLSIAWHLKGFPAWTQEIYAVMDKHLPQPFPDWRLNFIINIPKRTYISVPMVIIQSGGKPTFRDEEWHGAYQLKPLPIFDSARWFTSDLYNLLTKETGGGMVCVSFHASKTLGIEQGGCILHDSPEADAWLRRMRFDGRTEGVAPKDDTFREIGHHCYMSPSVAAQGLLKMYSLPKHNAPLPNDPYPDLSTIEVFK